MLCCCSSDNISSSGRRSVKLYCIITLTMLDCCTYSRITLGRIDRNSVIPGSCNFARRVSQKRLSFHHRIVYRAALQLVEIDVIHAQAFKTLLGGLYYANRAEGFQSHPERASGAPLVAAFGCYEYVVAFWREAPLPTVSSFMPLLYRSAVSKKFMPLPDGSVYKPFVLASSGPSDIQPILTALIASDDRPSVLVRHFTAGVFLILSSSSLAVYILSTTTDRAA